MPRRLRLRVSDCPLHIIQRGNNRAPCFFEDTDYLVYLQNLRTLSGEADCRIHAYVLMTNHVHLLLTPAAAEGPSNLMKNLGQRYVQYINRRYNRSGSLWEGRFRSSLVETERYFLTCQRYIELNPVRAGMVRTPEEYKWSSHAANGLGVPDSIVSPHPEYLRLGSSEEDLACARIASSSLTDYPTRLSTTCGPRPMAATRSVRRISSRRCRPSWADRLDDVPLGGRHGIAGRCLCKKWSDPVYLRPHSCLVARRAPSASDSSFAQQMSGWPTRWPRPQSVPAMTFSLPTRFA
jgi:putative transposase